MKKKVLVVDDNRLLRKFLSASLEKEGHLVKTAEDGFQALEMLFDFTPEIMFIDLFMPKIDGDRLCQIVRSRPELKDCYLVILSAGIAETEKDYTKIGANACIAKGSFSNMAKNVLAAIQDSNAPATKAEAQSIIGLDAVYSRQLTKELISRNRHLETILESMTEGFLEIFSERVVYANHAAVEILGKRMEKLLYATPPDLFIGKARAHVQQLLTGRSMPNDRQDTTFDLSGRKVTIKSYPVEGEPETSILILSDVTEQKRLEEKLQQAKKMEAIGTLAGGVAHDFNNLLMGIQGNISLMLMDVEEQDPNFEEIKSIERCVESAAKLTKQLLGFARGGKYTVKATSLNNLIRNLSGMFERTHKNIVFHKTYHSNLWAVEVDPGQIEQVVINLLLNACQAMPQKGDLYIRTENLSLDKKDLKSYDMKPGKYVKISIADTGTGISPDIQQRIFEPFFSTKKIGNGSGMGLASAFGIVKNHGGVIECRSELEKGSTFNVYLPASYFSTIPEGETQVDLLKGSETILIVDDEWVVLKVGRRLLKHLGYRVLIAKSGSAALKIFNACRDRIDLVILDIIMPEWNGEELYQRMKEKKPDVKVLLSSGYSIDWQARQMIENGCLGFIPKPYTMKDLSVQIRSILD
jgi:PAS domain S-box-containing protein